MGVVMGVVGVGFLVVGVWADIVVVGSVPCSVGLGV